MMSDHFKSKGIFKNMGAGDVLLKVSKTVELSQVIEKMWGPDCGCEERAAKLNKMMPRAASYEISEDQAAELLNIFKRVADKGGKLLQVDGVEIVRIHNQIFQKNSTFSTCPPCMKAIVQPLIVCLQANQYKAAGKNWTEIKEIEETPEDQPETIGEINLPEDQPETIGDVPRKPKRKPKK